MGDFGQVPARPIVLYLGAQPNCDDILEIRLMVFGYVWFTDCERYCCLVADSCYWAVMMVL